METVSFVDGLGCPSLAEVARVPFEESTLTRIEAHPAYAGLRETASPSLDARPGLAERGVALRVGDIAGLAEVFADTRARTGLALDVEIHALPEHGYEAFTLRNPFDGGLVLGISARLLDELDPREVAFVIGHEVGHHALGHVSGAGPRRARIAQLPRTHELRLLDLSLGRCQELSADRYGLLVCGDESAALSALCKASTQARNTRLAVGRALTSPASGETPRFVDPVLDGIAPWMQSHPGALVRSRALSSFARALAGPDPQAAARADREALALLDTMEADALKRDRATVRAFGSAVASVAAYAAARCGLGVAACGLAEELPSDAVAMPLPDALSFLRGHATRGRRMRVLEVALAIAAGDLRLGPEREALLSELARGLDLPSQAVVGRLSDMHHALALYARGEVSR
jgi:hypothetical protein